MKHYFRMETNMAVYIQSNFVMHIDLQLVTFTLVLILNVIVTDERRYKCEPNNQICSKNRLNECIRNEALQLHNSFRSRLARGKVRWGNRMRLPEGAAILKLKYDCDLEREARFTMKRCKRDDINFKDMTGEELNIDVLSHSSARSRLQALKLAIYNWWYTVKEHDPITMLVFTKDLENKTIKAFTRMAWDTTSHIGCYVRNCSDGYHVSCLYDYGGNIANDVIYEEGRACSRCKEFDLACGRQTRLCIEKKYRARLPKTPMRPR